MPKANKQLQDGEWLREQYVDKLRDGEDIANEVGATRSTVYRALRRHGIEVRKRTSKYALLNNKDWLRRTYLDEKKSIYEIVELTGSTHGNVHSALVSLGIEIRGVKEALQTAYPEGRFGELASNWRGGKTECHTPNPEYKKRLEERTPDWKARRKIASRGYIYVYAPDHPNRTKTGYVMEHRLIAEKHIGRYLEKNEIVHHRNGDRQDNRWENLQVMTRSQHVMEHFSNGFEVDYLREELAKRDARIAELEAELAALKGSQDE